jgi:site-specific DNA recombinase
MRKRKAASAEIARTTVAYCRVSTKDQALNGVSLEDQEARLRAYCSAMGWDGVEVLVDAGCSASSLHRPAMENLIERVSRGEIARVVVTKFDRAARSLRDLLYLVDLFTKYDVAFVCTGLNIDTSTPTGRMMLSLLGAIAELEREMIIERTRDALTQKRRTGKAYSAAPFGYRREGDSLVEEPTEQVALREAVRLDNEGLSFRKIGARLDEMGVRPHRGSAWHASSVRAVLRSKAKNETFGAHV